MNAPLAVYSSASTGSSSHRPIITAQRTAPSSSSWPDDFIHSEFQFESYIKSSLNVKLDNDPQICPDYAERLQCPRGASCPRRHVKPSQLNFLSANSTALRDPNKRTVCKHWLRGLCKKGDQCDYLHEFDMRRVPECRFYATFGFCNSGDDCLFLHIDKAIKRKECERYTRGFCPKGPNCPKKHVRRVACPYYLAGFCPEGLECKKGHIKATPISAPSRSTSPILTHRPLSAAEAFGAGGGGYTDGYVDRRAQTGRYGAPGAGGGAFTAAGGDPNGLARGRPNPGASGQPSQQGGGAGGYRKDLSEVLCFKCGEYGHFANACPNQNRPGNRGGMERGFGNTSNRGRPRPY